MLHEHENKNEHANELTNENEHEKEYDVKIKKHYFTSHKYRNSTDPLISPD
jgi:hypothetical protein